VDAPKYIVGLILGALIVFLISLPVYLKNNSVPASNEIKDNKLKVEASATEITTLKQELSDLNEKYTKMEKEKSNSDLMVDYYKNSIKLMTWMISLLPESMNSCRHAFIG
jgi:cell division protein FtsL